MEPETREQENNMSSNQPIMPNDMNPSVESPLESGGEGETTCPECEGHGTLKDHTECTNCGGTGQIAQPGGGA